MARIRRLIVWGRGGWTKQCFLMVPGNGFQNHPQGRVREAYPPSSSIPQNAFSVHQHTTRGASRQFTPLAAATSHLHASSPKQQLLGTQFWVRQELGPLPIKYVRRPQNWVRQADPFLGLFFASNIPRLLIFWKLVANFFSKSSPPSRPLDNTFCKHD